MDEEFQCEYCDKTFPEENAKSQHQRAVHPGEVSTPSEALTGEYTKHWFILGGLLLILVGVTIYFRGPLMAWVQGDDKTFPTVYDHWHSEYEVQLCGQTVPDFERREGDIHTHGKGLIHIHPKSEKTAGKAANLGAFMESNEAVLTDTKLAVPMRGTYVNGEKCPSGETGQVQVLVDGKRIDDPDGYVPQDGEDIVIKFGPVTE